MPLKRVDPQPTYRLVTQGAVTDKKSSLNVLTLNVYTCNITCNIIKISCTVLLMLYCLHT